MAAYHHFEGENSRNTVKKQRPFRYILNQIKLNYCNNSMTKLEAQNPGNKTFRPQTISPLVVSPLVLSPLKLSLVVSPLDPGRFAPII